jgi:serine/threonine protein kinase
MVRRVLRAAAMLPDASPDPDLSAPEFGADGPDLANEHAQQLIGQVIGGRYRVTGVIGQGGMGVVYGAMHLELEQPVAIKVLPAVYARDTETLKRFEQEAKTASRVKHANVVQVFDLGRLTTGEPYLAMELLDGSDLESVIQSGRTLSRSELFGILTPMAAALDALHKEKVVHRDVKPSNVFFARNSSGGETIKLVDFGLATLTAAGEGTERLTRVGHVVGTAVYMPPESARGALCEPSGDIYSLAVMAFELLVGSPPFDGQPMAVLMDKVTLRAPTLSKVSGQRYGADVEALFASALERDPARRPPTATDFVQRLERALANERPATGPTVVASPRANAPPQTATDDLELPRQRRPLLVGVGALALLLVAVGFFALRGSPTEALPVAPSPTTPTLPAQAAVDIDVPETAPEPVVEVAREPVAPVGSAPSSTSVREPRARVTPPSATPAPQPPAETHTEARVRPAPEEPTITHAEVTPESTDRSASLVREASSAMLHGEIPHARELYREATLAAPRNAAAWRGLGLASERLHLVPEARTAYERYLQIAPGAGDAETVRERLTRLGS